MKILQKEQDGKGSFYIQNGDEVKAEVSYVRVENTNKIIIDHTEVDDSLRGQGVGKTLVMRAVEFARENHIKIIPLCPYAKSVLEKDNQFQDVI